MRKFLLKTPWNSEFGTRCHEYSRLGYEYDSRLVHCDIASHYSLKTQQVNWPRFYCVFVLLKEAWIMRGQV
jgi:hypothetical protein